MRQLILNVKEDKLRFFMELIKNFDFVQVEHEEGDSKDAIRANIKKGLEEVKLIREGKLTKQSADDFLDEL